jgi:hypothetical protein
MTMLTLAFVLGLIVGGGVVIQAARSGSVTWLWRGRVPGRSNGVYGATLGPLKLNLPQSKRDSITAIVCRGMAAIDSLLQPTIQPRDSIERRIRPAIDSLFQEVRPAIDRRREQTRAEIGALLTPAQRVRYDSMNHANDDRRKKLRDQGGPSQNGGGGGPCTGNTGGQGPRGGFDRGSR